ncbi:nitrite reductase/ring-hydroxylating ferredoxin subunit [Paraburkholderia phenoliruptrix]|uniref:Rieske (2Fe-2S) protein n=1 Tax=Paraburkholderia phenoliruptrix TaxID=252970 RepID=UPI00285C95D3|nr:Rieske 2Fe-2S domain-containing protein [Paraburkholderia phenoliruptrix]MDR6423794.1 nitrite reductase/ring-hydroxylating ferredoxin subunit [Paraburkholderia phenoliruptrix]
MSVTLPCALDQVPDGGALAASRADAGVETRVIVVRRGAQVWAYENRCPHFSVGLDYEADKVLTYDGAVLMCAHHSALFRFEDGHCIEGPCEGAGLTAIEVCVVDDQVRCS